MSIQIEDILAIACSSVKLTHSNDFQRVFLLSSSSEARLAFDVLVAHGFDVKAYHQEDDTSKLYVTHPTLSASQLESALSAAKAYVITLKQIKLSLDTLRNDNKLVLGALEYNMTFANSQPNGKQLIVQITPLAVLQDATSTNATVAPTSTMTGAIAAQSSGVTVAQPVVAPQTKFKYKTKVKGHYEEFSSGPAVGRGKYAGAIASDGTVPEETLKRRVMLYLFGNMATSSYAMVIMVLILGIIFTIFVFAKAFICPDFASMAVDHAWYCHTAADDEREQKQQEKVRQLEHLGLQPTQER